MREEIEICIKEFFEEVKEIDNNENITIKSQMGDFMEEAKNFMNEALVLELDKEMLEEENLQEESLQLDAKENKFEENNNKTKQLDKNLVTPKKNEEILKEDINLEIKEIFESIFEYEAIFNYAHAHVAKVEGGLSDHKNDPGGITKYGISLAFLEDYAKTQNGRKVLTKLKMYNISRESILKLTKEQSKNIMYNAFWLSTEISKLPPLLAIIAYDFAVNSGSYYACRLIQRAIGAKVDGIIGKETLAKAYNLDIIEQKKVAKFMLEERVKFYQNLAKSKPKFNVFLKGWLSRVEILRVYLNSISK